MERGFLSEKDVSNRILSICLYSICLRKIGIRFLFITIPILLNSHFEKDVSLIEFKKKNKDCM